MHPTKAQTPDMQLWCEGQSSLVPQGAPSQTPLGPQLWSIGHAAASPPHGMEGTTGSAHLGGLSVPLRHLS